MPPRRSKGRIVANDNGRFEWHTTRCLEEFLRNIHTFKSSPKFLFAGARWEFRSGKSGSGESLFSGLWITNVECMPHPQLKVILGIRTSANVTAEHFGKTRASGDYGLHWGILLIDSLRRWEETRREALVAYCQLEVCHVPEQFFSPSVSPSTSRARPDSEKEDRLSKRLRVDSEKAKKETRAAELNSRRFKNLLSLSDHLKELFLNGDGSDLTLIVMGKEFRVHSVLLQARSPVFSSMITHDMLEKNSGVVKIEDCKPEAFHGLLHYLYTGKMEGLTEDNVFQMYYAADKYDVMDLKLNCVDFITRSLSPEAVCGVITLAKLHSETDLLIWATDYFVKNADKVLETAEWQNFLREYPTEANELYIKALKSSRI